MIVMIVMMVIMLTIRMSIIVMIEMTGVQMVKTCSNGFFRWC